MVFTYYQTDTGRTPDGHRTDTGRTPDTVWTHRCDSRNSYVYSNLGGNFSKGGIQNYIVL